MLLVTVNRPAPGLWKLRLEGRGRYAVTVRSRRTKNAPAADPPVGHVEILAFRFVERRGRPGHEGYFEIRGKVRAGEERVFEVVVMGKPQSIKALFVSRDGKPLGACPVRASDPEEPSDRYLVDCVVPKKPFRLLIRGRNSSGKPFQRIYAPIVGPLPPPAAPGKR